MTTSRIAPGRPGLLACALLLALALLFPATPASAETVRVKASRLTSKTIVFDVRELRGERVRSARVVGGGKVRRVRRARVRRAIRHGRLRIATRRIYRSRGRKSSRRKPKKPVVIVVTEPAPDPDSGTAPAPEPTQPAIEPAPAPGPAPVPAASEPVPAGAKHVSPAGSDSNPGTAEQPWRTLAKAASSAVAGDTVVFHAGEYGLYGTRTEFSRSGSSGAPITFRGAPGEARPTFLGGIKISGSLLRFQGILFDGPTGPVLARTTGNPGGEDVQIALYGDDVEISSSEIRDNLWHAGIYLNNADRVQIVGNYIHDNGDFSRPEQSNLDHGIYWGRGSGLVANNVIDHNLAFGVHIYPHGSNIVVKHNTITNHGKAGVIIAENAANNLVVNNIVAYNRDNSIRSYDLSGTGNVVRRNLVWGNGNGNIGSSAAGLALVDNIEADPRFVAPGDYRVGAGSPAIDAAAMDETIGFDYLGVARSIGSAPDIGAYEAG